MIKLLKLIQGITLFCLLIPIVFLGGFFASFLLIAFTYLLLPMWALAAIVYSKQLKQDPGLIPIMVLNPARLPIIEATPTPQYESNLIYISDVLENNNLRRDYTNNLKKVSNIKL